MQRSSRKPCATASSAGSRSSGWRESHRSCSRCLLRLCFSRGRFPPRDGPGCPRSSSLGCGGPFGGVHGTSVASVVGAQENGVGIVGVYPEAVIRSWDAATGLGTELTSGAIVNGILASSQRGRSVINLSLGGRDPDAAIEAAVNLAVARGSLVVAASGNDGEEGSPLSFPAAFPHVLTVAATQEDGSVAPFSSASRFVDLAAPGAQIPVATLDPETGTPTWALADGTSFAAPLVSGAAAWIWTLRPSLDAGQVAQILRSTATDIGAPGRDPASGFGLLNLPAALALPAPVKDQSESNDDVDDVTPGREGFHGTPAFHAQREDVQPHKWPRRRGRRSPRRVPGLAAQREGGTRTPVRRRRDRSQACPINCPLRRAQRVTSRSSRDRRHDTDRRDARVPQRDRSTVRAPSRHASHREHHYLHAVSQHSIALTSRHRHAVAFLSDGRLR